jgi:hypothetical protein
MKKYTLEWLNTHRRLTNATRPKPFPGKFPTRIAWEFTFHNGETHSYVGKPSRWALVRYWNLIKPDVKEYWALEFDRSGSVARIKAVYPYLNEPETAIASIRWVYHPWTEDRERFYRRSGRWVNVDAKTGAKAPVPLGFDAIGMFEPPPFRTKEVTKRYRIWWPDNKPFEAHNVDVMARQLATLTV